MWYSTVVPGGRDTTWGGPAGGFPSTRWATILQAQRTESAESRAALEELCRRYWKPIYVYIRMARRAAAEEAKDLAQEFVLEMIEGNLLSRYSLERGGFRSYLRGALQLFLREQHRKAGAARRGGGRAIRALDALEGKVAAGLAVDPGLSPEEAFEVQWGNALVEGAVEELHRELVNAGRELDFRLFERYELRPPPEGPPTYARLAEEFGLKRFDVNHALTACRRRLREIVFDHVRDYVVSEDEVAHELRLFFRS